MNATGDATRQSEPAPRPGPRVVPPQNDHSLIDDEIAATVEAQLAQTRVELTAKLVAEKLERERARKEAEKRESQEYTRSLLVKEEVTPEELLKFRQLLLASGVRLMPANPVDDTEEDSDGSVSAEDYAVTERTQLELLALLSLKGVVRTKDVIQHVRREDGKPMSPSNVRYHMRKLTNKGRVYKIEERYHMPHIGWRTRDAWSTDPQKLLELLEGKGTVRS